MGSGAVRWTSPPGRERGGRGPGVLGGVEPAGSRRMRGRAGPGLARRLRAAARPGGRRRAAPGRSKPRFRRAPRGSRSPSRSSARRPPLRLVLAPVLLVEREIRVLPEPAEGGVLPVMDEGVAGAADLPSLGTHAAAVVAVLEEPQPEALVERTGGREHLAPRRDAEEREHRDLEGLAVVAADPRRRPSAAAPRDPRSRRRSSPRWRSRWSPDRPARASRSPPGGGGARSTTPRHDGVVVQEDERVPGRRRQTGVAGRGKAPILAKRDHPEIRVGAGELRQKVRAVPSVDPLSTARTS